MVGGSQINAVVLSFQDDDLSWKPTSERTATPQESVNTENWLKAQKSSGALSRLCGIRMSPTPGSRLLWSTEKCPGGQRCLPPRPGRRAPPWAVGHWTSSWKRWKGRGPGWGTPVCGTNPPAHAVSRTEPRWGGPPSRRSCAGRQALQGVRRHGVWLAEAFGHRLLPRVPLRRMERSLGLVTRWWSDGDTFPSRHRGPCLPKQAWGPPCAVQRLLTGGSLLCCWTLNVLVPFSV